MKGWKITHGVCKGFPVSDDDLDGLPDQMKNKIAVVMARISEASYRRGIQHGAVFSAHNALGSENDLHDYRYKISLDSAPCADVKGHPPIHGMETAIDRVDCEYGASLSEWGLRLWDYLPKKAVGGIPNLDDERWIRRVRNHGRDGMSDAEIIGGAFCDGIAAGVDPMKLHQAYFNTFGADQFEAAVWREIELKKRRDLRAATDPAQERQP